MAYELLKSQENLIQLTNNSMHANRTQVLNLDRQVSQINPPISASKNAVPIQLVRVVADFVKLKFMYPKKYVTRLTALATKAMFSSPSIAACTNWNVNLLNKAKQNKTLSIDERIQGRTWSGDFQAVTTIYKKCSSVSSQPSLPPWIVFHISADSLVIDQTNSIYQSKVKMRFALTLKKREICDTNCSKLS